MKNRILFRAKRVDANHAMIKKAFQTMGCSIADISSVGKGIGDLIVATNGRTLIIEVKDGSKPASQRKLTDAEVKFHAYWKDEIPVVESIQDVEKTVNHMRNGRIV